MKIHTIINGTGTVIGVVGAVLNSMGNPIAFPLWMVSNTLLMVLFIGIYRGWWTLNSGALLQIALYGVYFGTSTYGAIRSFG